MSPYIAPGIKTIEDIASEIWKIPVESITTKTRKRDVVEARQVLMAYIKQQTSRRLNLIAKEYMKDHSTIFHAIKTVNNLKETNKEFRIKYESFIQQANQIPKIK